MVKLRIEPVDDDGKMAASLRRWLREDPDTRRDLLVAATPEVRPGSMGTFDVVMVIISQLTGIGSLAVAIATWRDTRSHTPTLRITIGKESFEIRDGSAEQVGAALTAFIERNATQQIPDE